MTCSRRRKSSPAPRSSPSTSPTTLDSRKDATPAAEALASARKALDAETDAYTPIRGASKSAESPLDLKPADVFTYPTTSTGRRTALANWLTDRKNPLTARVAVNHIWMRHFGTPLVPTVFDFGRKGTPPTHPALLDWLAVDFMEHGWSMKRLHRMIVTSDAYRRSSSAAGADPKTLAADPENRLYWRMNPRRMEAQVVRDSLLTLAGVLVETPGGPPISPSEEESPRRSLYFVHSHNDHARFLTTFDDAGVLDCYRRAESVVPAQALALWNSKLAMTMGSKIAARLDARLGRVDDSAFAAEAFRTILASPPKPDELAACEQALAELKTLLVKRGAADPARKAREILVQSLLNHNDFITVPMTREARTMTHHDRSHPPCPGSHRRRFLADMGMGFTGLALGAMLQRDGIARASSEGIWTPPDGRPHFAPKAKSVIWLFMNGGVSHMETFDPKPELNKYAGKTIAETPYKGTQDPKKLALARVVVVNDANGQQRGQLYPLQVGWKKYGQSGTEVSDWLPNIGNCVDDIAVIRSMWTTDNNHGAQTPVPHRAARPRRPSSPTIGSWIHYGLGSLNDDLPQLRRRSGRRSPTAAGAWEADGAGYLGPEHDGVRRARSTPPGPLPLRPRPGKSVSAAEEQRGDFALDGPAQPDLRTVQVPRGRRRSAARIKSYELAYPDADGRCPRLIRPPQCRAPRTTADPLRDRSTRPLPRVRLGRCLAARRLVERGSPLRPDLPRDRRRRPGGLGRPQRPCKANHSRQLQAQDRPADRRAAQGPQADRGLLDDTIVVWATEFGRTPGAQNADGPGSPRLSASRSGWPAAGSRGGSSTAATDELGFHAVTDRHYVTDIHATILHLMGLDSRKLEVPGRKRLEIDHGTPIPRDPGVSLGSPPWYGEADATFRPEPRRPPSDPTMTGEMDHPPEPLRSFGGIAGAEAVAPALLDVEAAHDRYRGHRDAGRILANSVEALRIELTYHSNAIEGSTLTLRETQLVVEGFAPAGGKTLREVYEARNHDRALREIERWATGRPSPSSLTEQDILDVHAQVLADIDDRSADRFRSGRVLITGTRFVPPGSHKFGELITNMLELANRDGQHPVLQAAELHYNLVAIHPFTDGNGRTARLFMNYHLLRQGYPLTIIEVEQRAEYLSALEDANAGRCEPFAAFILRSTARSIERLIGED